jgi:hypothetical protein
VRSSKCDRNIDGGKPECDRRATLDHLESAERPPSCPKVWMAPGQSFGGLRECQAETPGTSEHRSFEGAAHSPLPVRKRTHYWSSGQGVAGAGTGCLVLGAWCLVLCRVLGAGCCAGCCAGCWVLGAVLGAGCCAGCCAPGALCDFNGDGVAVLEMVLGRVNLHIGTGELAVPADFSVPICLGCVFRVARL